jgi:tetratricopeptide (TPR) repeat protein
VLLAQEGARSEDEAKNLYKDGVAAGERALGRKAFKEDVGHFWGILETRPYMRALHGLAQCVWHLGDRGAAIQHFSEMLRLNPNDNQGVRYQLAACLLEAGRNDELEKLLAQYDEDGTAYWAYARALLSFRRGGDTAASRKLLTAAISTNKHVPEYLTGRRKRPRHLPDYVGFGDENEAIAFVAEHGDAWKLTPGALEWLAAAGPGPAKGASGGRRKTTTRRAAR